MKKRKFKNIVFLRILRKFFVLLGIFFTVCVILALTEQPFWGYYWLGTSKSELTETPRTIILLGGSGMPSQSNLMRCWYTEKAGKAFPEAAILIAIPGDISDSTGTPTKINRELIKRGLIDRSFIFEREATNTRSQAINCKKQLSPGEPILLVTSPEHMRRAVLCFQKVGFQKVNALPAFENALEADLSFDDDQLGGNKRLVPDVGKSINIRYQLWNHLKYEIVIAREMAALAYYKFRGWI
ncbi:MAG: hypothetical protein CSA36_01660 [Draconibacterium sp.]|nr:MAG: hypothetical protein CSA36_01660 [Draconibacterium sp.]